MQNSAKIVMNISTYLLYTGAEQKCMHANIMIFCIDADQN